jgi:hypothetical protein
VGWLGRDLGDVVVPQAVRPVQLCGGRSAAGARRLLLAVIELAFADLHHPHHRDAALDWITGRGPVTGPPVGFVFDTVCDHLGLDADVLRAAALRIASRAPRVPGSRERAGGMGLPPHPPFPRTS